MTIYIYGSKSFKNSINKVLKRANIKFRLSDEDSIVELSFLHKLKDAIEENPKNIFLIDDEKIVKKNSLLAKINFLKPKDGIEEEFLEKHGIEDLVVDDIEDIATIVIRKLEKSHAKKKTKSLPPVDDNKTSKKDIQGKKKLENHIEEKINTSIDSKNDEQVSKEEITSIAIENEKLKEKDDFELIIEKTEKKDNKANKFSELDNLNENELLDALGSPNTTNSTKNNKKSSAEVESKSSNVNESGLVNERVTSTSDTAFKDVKKTTQKEKTITVDSIDDVPTISTVNFDANPASNNFGADEKVKKISYTNKKHLNKHDYEFMNSLSAAVMLIRPNRLHWVLVSFTVSIFLFIIWASFAKIDEISRGSGKVVPSGQNQILQNLEGGIITEILIKEGDLVKEGQILVRINNEKSESSVASGRLKILSLKAQVMRLKAELQQLPFQYKLTDDELMNQFLENEKKLFEINKEQLDLEVEILKEQLNQKNNQLQDARQTKDHLKRSLSMISQEVKMTEPMVQRGIRSQVDFLKLQREENDAKQKSSSAILAIGKAKSEIKETQNKINEVYEANKAEVGEKLNERITELKELEATLVGYEDQVDRTIIKSPSNGIVQKLHVNTIGGAIKPAQDLIEIVPTDFNLIVEVKILPSDIAFIYQGQNAIVKFSAYDFSIFGGLKGNVINISPDTITDEKEDKTYYLVRIQTEKNFLGSQKESRKIIPGMVADVDIITGKKSILDYILKPILKTKQYTLTER